MKKAFTLAEVLITLSIIGIVAMIVLPSIIGDFSEKAMETRKKALISRITLAITNMDNLNGYGNFSTQTNSETGEETVEKDTVAEDFVLKGFAKYFKVGTFCPYDETKQLTDCGISTSYLTIDGKSKPLPRTFGEYVLSANAEGQMITGAENRYASKGAFLKESRPVAFITANGDSVAVYYNPYCGEKQEATSTDYGLNHTNSVCVNFLYDINGLKGPNQFGKDLGMITAFSRTNPIVAGAIPLIEGTEWLGKKERGKILISSNEENATSFCNNVNGKIPTMDELLSFVVNGYYSGVTTGGAWWSSTYFDGKFAYIQFFSNPPQISEARLVRNGFVCIKKVN